MADWTVNPQPPDPLGPSDDVALTLGTTAADVGLVNQDEAFVGYPRNVSSTSDLTATDQAWAFVPTPVTEIPDEIQGPSDYVEITLAVAHAEGPLWIEGHDARATKGGAGAHYDVPAESLAGLIDDSVTITLSQRVTDLGFYLVEDPSVIPTVHQANNIPLVFWDSAKVFDLGVGKEYRESVDESQEQVDWSTQDPKPGGFISLFGVAVADGNTGQMLSNDALITTFTGSAVAAADGLTSFGTFAGIRSIMGFATAAGNVGVLAGGVGLSSTTGAARATGSVSRLWTPDAWIRSANGPGLAAARGRGALLYSGNVAPMSGSAVYAFTDCAAHLTPNPTQMQVPTLVPSQMVKFSVDPWRLRNGVAVAEAAYCAQATSEVVIGSSSTGAPFIDPSALTGFAHFRWLAEDYEDSVQWYPSGTSSDFSEVRSWQNVADLFTWTTLMANSWNQVLWDTQDPDIPVWAETAAAAALKLDYTYWRIAKYVTSPAVLIVPGVSLALDWGVGTAPGAQVTMAAVFVPRLLTVGSYELITASNDIKVTVRSDATIQLQYGDQVLSTTAIGARTRPNEPVVVAVSISPTDRRVLLGVMDTEVRVTSSVIPATVVLSNLDWQINADAAGTFELLEASMLIGPLYPSSMTTWLSRYDQVYGVTLV